jgi:glycerophosphoryl diester phosphodiesterase
MSNRQSQLTDFRPLCIAHRGASMEAPENTVAAFRRALALGADGIELDVQVTRDRTAVVFHDTTLTRLAHRRERLARLVFRELRGIRIQGEPIPTLAEVLALARRRAVVQIEIKRGVPVAPVVHALHRARADTGVVLASFDTAIVATARRLAPRLPRMLITRGGGRGRAETLVPVLAALGATGVSIDHRAIQSPAFVTALHRCGLCVWCWTVNDARAMLRCASWGVDAILSDNPALLQSTLAGSYREARPPPVFLPAF